MKQQTINQFELEYRELLLNAIENGVNRNDRTGVGCNSLFSQNLKWSLLHNELPMITGRRIYPKIFITEFHWFINGETNIKRFQDADVKIWNDWADDKGELGPGTYGDSMINFDGQQNEYFESGIKIYLIKEANGINQLDDVIHNIIKFPDSRRHIISLWNPKLINKQALPPCYHDFQFFIDADQGLIHMHVKQRSADLFLGIPYDVCLFSLFLQYIAEKTKYKAGMISLTMIDAHVYKNHHEQIKKYFKTDINSKPTFKMNGSSVVIENYKYNSLITGPVAI